MRDFPHARGQFHDRLILHNRRASDRVHTDHGAKALYREFFCQRFIMEAEVRLPQHYTGSMLRKLSHLMEPLNSPIPVEFKARVGHMPATFPTFPPLAPNETSSLTLEWVPRSGVALTDANMDLLQRAFAFIAHLMASDPNNPYPNPLPQPLTLTGP